LTKQKQKQKNSQNVDGTERVLQARCSGRGWQGPPDGGGAGRAEGDDGPDSRLQRHHRMHHRIRNLHCSGRSFARQDKD
jgi:hypothetical protein